MLLKTLIPVSTAQSSSSHPSTSENTQMPRKSDTEIRDVLRQAPTPPTSSPSSISRVSSISSLSPSIVDVGGSYSIYTPQGQTEFLEIRLRQLCDTPSSTRASTSSRV